MRSIHSHKLATIIYGFISFCGTTQFIWIIGPADQAKGKMQNAEKECGAVAGNCFRVLKAIFI